MTIAASSCERGHRCRADASAGRSRLWSMLVVGTLGLLGALLLAPASSLAAAGSAPCANPSPAKKLCLSVIDSPDPVAYSVFDGNSTWLQYTAELSNPGRSKLSRVQLRERLPKGTT